LTFKVCLLEGIHQSLSLLDATSSQPKRVQKIKERSDRLQLSNHALIW
jgi:hypothetical protein